MIIYPKPLRRGMTIGVTGPSGGVAARHHKRLDLALKNLKLRGFNIVEGECLRSEHKHVSGPKQERANDLTRLWTDKNVDMIYPPWGGELLIEVLPLLDFDELKKTPKWIMGYSDTSTLLIAITILTDIATAHGTNLMDSISSQNDPLTAGALNYFTTPRGGSFTQKSSERWQKTWTDLETEPERGFDLTERTTWKVLGKKHSLSFTGRLIGGCLDTLASLTGTKYGDVAAFSHRYKGDRIIIYLENCEQSPCSLSRIIWNFRMAGWFENAAGIVLGRSAGPNREKENQLTYNEALEQALGDLDIPVIYDADIGHLPPQMTLINGALANVSYKDGHGAIAQTLA
jgi:muramoyltetrapeptide carboxypeptidase